MASNSAGGGGNQFGWGGVLTGGGILGDAQDSDGEGRANSRDSGSPAVVTATQVDAGVQTNTQAAPVPLWATGAVAQDVREANQAEQQKKSQKQHAVKGASKKVASQPQIGTGGYNHLEESSISDGNYGRSTSDVTLISDSVADAKLKEVERRERAVAQRERNVADIETQLEQGGVTVRRNNWPRCKPFLYHDINAEIPTPNQACCRAGYACWIMSATSYLYNFLAVTLM
mmetsp:Transcript_15014/g.38187  ORF Transcript_15014/g.38187 Transcript_15014/m.38187 type:complete len:230 (+) Transcript_15014:41-730(+)